MANTPNLTSPTPEKLDAIIDTAELDEGLGKLQTTKLTSLGATYFSHKSRRSMQLIERQASEASETIPARREWYSYDFKDILFISSVEIVAEGYSDYHEMELSFTDSFSKTEKILETKFLNGRFLFKIGRFIQGFGFRPPSKFYGSVSLTSVKVLGLEPTELETLISTFENVSVLKGQIKSEADRFVEAAALANQKAEKLDTELLNKKDREVELNNELEALRSSIQQLGDSSSQKKKEIESQNETIVEKQKAMLTLDEQIEKRTSERKSLGQEITNAEKKLSDFRRDIHLFPSEIAGYVKQGARNIWLYVGLSGIPFAVICAVTYKLFANAENLLQAFLLRNDIKILDYLISRLPYAVVSIAILTICYTLLYRLFAEIISINRRKQDLFKVSIIATDVSVASQHGLELTDDESYNFRTQTKMELLKEHLRHNISADYSYGKHGGIMQNILESVRKKLEASNGIKEENQ